MNSESKTILQKQFYRKVCFLLALITQQALTSSENDEYLPFVVISSCCVVVVVFAVAVVGVGVVVF